jgi:outer membrane protein TolC
MWGCAVEQGKEVQAYRSLLGGELVEGKFDPGEPVNLERALKVTNQRNEQLAIAGEDYLQALIDEDRAAARFLPPVSFNPTYVRQDEIVIPGGGGFPASLFPNPTLDLPVDARLEANIPADVSNMGKAKNVSKQRRALLLDLKARTLLDTAKVFFQVLRSERQADALQNSLRVQEELGRVVRARQKAGAATRLEVNQAEAQLASTRATLIRAENDVRNGRSVLAFLMGVSSVQGPLSDELDVPAAPFRPRRNTPTCYRSR